MEDNKPQEWWMMSLEVHVVPSNLLLTCQAARCRDLDVSHRSVCQSDTVATCGCTVCQCRQQAQRQQIGCQSHRLVVVAGCTAGVSEPFVNLRLGSPTNSMTANEDLCCAILTDRRVSYYVVQYCMKYIAGITITKNIPWVQDLWLAYACLTLSIFDRCSQSTCSRLDPVRKLYLQTIALLLLDFNFFIYHYCYIVISK